MMSMTVVVATAIVLAIVVVVVLLLSPSLVGCVILRTASDMHRPVGKPVRTYVRLLLLIARTSKIRKL